MRPYEIFLREYDSEPIITEESELFDFFDESERPGVFKDGYYFRDNLQNPIISPVLELKKNRDAIIEFTGKFMDDNSDKLSTSGPVYIVTFSARETQFFYDMFGLSPEKMIDMYLEMVKNTYYGEISKTFTGWIKNAPHKLLLVGMLVESFSKGYDDIIECCEYLLAFCDYPIIYRDFWKIGVKEDVMNYTIEHLGTKFKIKQMKNIRDLLKYDATIAVEFYANELKIGADNTYLDLIRRIRNNISSKFRKIANAYYANDDGSHTQHNDQSQFDDGSLTDNEGHTTIAAQIIEKTISKFAAKEINASMVRVAANASNIDNGNLSGFIAQINATKNNRMNKLIENIIMAFFDKNPTTTSVGTSEFLNFGLSVYRSIGTSKDPILAEIKDILQYWMNTIINIRSMYNREATVINYTRAIYNYIILMINYYN